MWEMIKAEFRHIRHNKLLLLSSIVICFIPFLYSIFFLKSVWDPYGTTQNLPVAVVNKDVPVEFQGKRMAVGDTMVKELKKNKSLKWEFVSPSEAKYGMSHRKYYTVVTIPKNFSKDATTALDKHPKKMHLQYETNGSLNYIGEVISQVGMNRLNQTVRASVTRAYATAMFKALHVVGKGMNQAASGANQLNNGLVTLRDGVNQYVAGVSLVNNGVQTLQMGVAPLAAGAQQLASGSATLANGVARYTGGVRQLSGGLNQLNANSGSLQSGSQQLANGAGQLNSVVNSQLGSIDFSGIMGAMNDAQKLQNSLGTLQAGLDSAETALTEVKKNAQPLEQASGTIGTTSTAVQSHLGKVMQTDGAIAAQLKAIADQKQTSDPQLSRQLDGLAAQAKGNIDNAQQVGNDLQSLQSLSGSLSGMQAQLGKLSNMSEVLNQAQGIMNQANSLINTLNSYSGQLKGMPAQLSQLRSATGQIAAGANALNAGVGQYTAGVAQAGAGANQLNANSGALNSGAGQLAGALGQLNAQVPALVGGVNQLANGTQQLVDNSPALVQGVVRLNNGAGQLATALGRGARQVNGIKTSNKTADMIAKPTKMTHKNYSYVPNYGHALAPYVLSVALYVGALIFNFIYPIRRVALPDKSPAAWWASKVVLGSLVITLMALAEGGIMMALGLNVIHVPSFLGTLVLFGLASMAVVMFLSMTFDNPGRFVAMVLLMLQLGGSGGTFPMEVTMKFYNVIHWYLPMTYSILGLRDGISGGLGSHYVAFCNGVLGGIAVVFFILTLFAMIWLQHHHFAGKSELDNNQELLGPEKDDDGMHLQDRDKTV